MSVNDVFDDINKKAYSGNLEIVNEITSVNCKEWEEERKYLENKNGESFPMATRFYVRIKDDGEDELNSHYHKGHIDFRSISDSISDAFLPIPKRNNFFVTCGKSYKSDDPFHPTIITVPYATPTKEISLCSPASIWIVLTTLSYEFGKEYLSLVDINTHLPDESIFGAVSINEYSQLFKDLGYSELFYVGNKINQFYNSDNEDFDEAIMDSELLYAYIESEIPVYLVFKWNDLRKELGCGNSSKDYHTVVAIGHTLDETGNVSKFVIHDVSCGPFLEISKKMVDENLQEAIVLLPKNIKIRYESALKNLLSSDVYKVINNTVLKDSSQLVYYRPFLMRSQRIKYWYTNKHLYPLEVQSMYSQADFPQYVWVFEISTPELNKNNKCIGQIIFDATKPNDNIVLMNFPKYRLWYNNGELVEKHVEDPEFESFHLFRDQSINM